MQNTPYNGFRPITSALLFGLLASAAMVPFANAAELNATSFTADFSAMAQLKDLAGKVKGKIAVLLPETTTSARYTSFDEPYLKKAFAAAGLKADQYIITNAQGSESTELTQAQSAISQGASALVVDPISSGGGGGPSPRQLSHPATAVWTLMV